MAGQDQADGVRRVGPADRTGGAPEVLRHDAVAGGDAEGHGGEVAPEARLELGAVRREGQVEILACTGKVLLYLAPGVRSRLRVLDGPFALQAGGEGIGAAEHGGSHSALVVYGDCEGAEGGVEGVVAGRHERAPLMA